MKPSYVYLVTSTLYPYIKLGVTSGDGAAALRDRFEFLLGPDVRVLLYETSAAHAVEGAFRRRFKVHNIELRIYDKAHAAAYEAFLCPMGDPWRGPASPCDRCSRVPGLGLALHPPPDRPRFDPNHLADELLTQLVPGADLDGLDTYVPRSTAIEVMRTIVERLSPAHFLDMRRRVELSPKSFTRVCDMTHRKYTHLIIKLLDHTHAITVTSIRNGTLHLRAPQRLR